jgi:gamma-glutamylcyclotransferase (GGCT)/AIG2-like uncharacterized protein YtfP
VRFFLYGTLTADSGNDVARRFHTLLKPGIPAAARGCLYAIKDELGWYPGLVSDPAGEPVWGFLHESTGRFAPEDLAEIDRYENFDPEAPDNSEFLRREVIVETGSGRVLAHAYVLRTPPVMDFVTVRGGCFASFLEETGMRPFDAGQQSLARPVHKAGKVAGHAMNA